MLVVGYCVIIEGEVNTIFFVLVEKRIASCISFAE